MASKVQEHAVVVSTLNPNAPLFVPAAMAKAMASHSVEDFSSEWWSLVQTCPEFREQWMRDRLLASEEQQMFQAGLEELADLDAFLEYQDEMEAATTHDESSLHFDDDDLVGFLEDDLSLSNINQTRYVKVNPKPQTPWCKPLKNHDKVAHTVPNSTKKGNAYRIQQPRPVM